MRKLITLYNLLTNSDLSYNQYGKDNFREVGIAAMKSLAKFLKLKEFDAHFNMSGIACSGDLTLMGMFDDKIGIYISINQDMGGKGFHCLYRTITHMKDYSGGGNNYIRNKEDFTNPTKLKEIIYRLCMVTDEYIASLPKTKATKKATTKQISKVNTIEDLEKLGIGNVYADFSHRGGGVGFYSSDVARFLNISQGLLPSKVGAGCNYLGGGIRGSIFGGSFSDDVPESKKPKLQALIDACVRAYKNAENESGLNNEEEEDGETNWEAKGTNAAREQGTISYPGL